MDHYVEIRLKGFLPNGSKGVGHKVIVMSETLMDDLAKLMTDQGLVEVEHSAEMKRVVARKTAA